MRPGTNESVSVWTNPSEYSCCIRDSGACYFCTSDNVSGFGGINTTSVLLNFGYLFKSDYICVAIQQMSSRYSNTISRCEFYYLSIAQVAYSIVNSYVLCQLDCPLTGLISVFTSSQFRGHPIDGLTYTMGNSGEFVALLVQLHPRCARFMMHVIITQTNCLQPTNINWTTSNASLFQIPQEVNHFF